MLKGKRIELLIITSLCIIVWLVMYSSILNEKFIVNDDQPHNTAWMYKYSTNNFLENDIIIEFTEKIQPWGYWLIFSTTSKIIDPLILTKLFTLPLLFISIFFIYLFLRKFYNFNLTIIGIFLLFPVGIIAGAHARAFAFPFLFAFLYYYSYRKHIICYIIFISSVLFYPIISLIIVLFYFFGEIYNYIRKKKIVYRKILIFAFCMLIVGSIAVTKSIVIKQDKNIGRMYTKKEIMLMPEFSKTGRYLLQAQTTTPHKFFFEYTISSLRRYVPVRFGSINDELKEKLKNIYYSFLLRFAITLAFIIILILYGKSIIYNPLYVDIITIILFLSGIILYYLATQLPDLLYFPEKYLRYTFQISIGLVFLKLLNGVDKRFIYLISGFIVMLFLVKNPREKGYIDYSENKTVYDFIDNINRKSLIAGPLMISDQIPIICRKSVLFSFESSNVVFKHYWEKQKEKIFDYYTAIYAPSELELEKFIKKYHIDYLLYNLNYYSEPSDFVEFEPIGSFILNQKSTSVNPLLNDLNNEAVTDLHNGYYILDCVKYFNLKSQ
ncbi:hypothetical protein ACFLTA_02975 [Bacteroidota bacterium]